METVLIYRRFVLLFHRFVKKSAIHLRFNEGWGVSTMFLSITYTMGSFPTSKGRKSTYDHGCINDEMYIHVWMFLFFLLYYCERYIEFTLLKWATWLYWCIYIFKTSSLVSHGKCWRYVRTIAPKLIWFKRI